MTLALICSEDGRRFRPLRQLELSDVGTWIIGVVHPKVAHLVETAATHHVSSNRLMDAITLIVEEATPPIDDRTTGLEVTSFLASGSGIVSLLTGFPDPLDRWCYSLMHHVLAQDRLICELRVTHKSSTNPTILSGLSCDVVLPHRGPESYLRLSVDSILSQTQVADIFVAIDQREAGANFLADVVSENRVKAFQLSPYPVGPYVPRHVLSMRSNADAVGYQDSDDISLPDRLAILAQAAKRHDAGIVGSHELQVHQKCEKVYAIRYPLDVNASLRRAGANHQILFPTTFVKSDVIKQVGGFSTFREYSLDVNFWLSASFQTKIINVDEFLYVRRRHMHSLTMRDDIGTNSLIRRRLVSKRRDDFEAVQNGSLRLEDSSLAVSHLDRTVSFSDLKHPEAPQFIFEPNQQ